MTHRYAGWLVGLLLGPATLGFGQASSDQNYTITNTLREAGHTNEATVPQLSAGQRQQQVTYYDGLGRPTQTVDWQASPAGYDVVTPTVYDALGRTPRQYLPYVAGSNDATFHPAAVPEQSWFYQPGSSTGRNEKVARDNHPYAESVYEASPLNRVTEQGAAGQTWQPGQGHTQTFDERPNRLGEVRHFRVTGSTCASDAYYLPGQLWVKETRDEHGAVTLEYTDKLGQLVLKRQAPENGEADQLTYYVYDELQRLRLVIPPEASQRLPTLGASGQLVRELWWNTPGPHVADIPRTRHPDQLSILSGDFSAPTNQGDHYGQRLRGYVVAPQTGYYVFALTSDDDAELWLSGDGEAGHAQLRLHNPSWSPLGDWSRQSAPVLLQKDQHYYIEALHKEHEGGDHLAVGWRLPDGSFQGPIPAAHLRSDALTLPVDFVAMWCFAYTYDGRGRVIEKRVPGAGVEEFVYNQRDQVIMRRTSLLQQAARWQFTKYDALGRVVLVGQDTYSGEDRATWQSWADASPLPAYETRDGSAVGYSLNQSFPQMPATASIESVNYYDDYDYAALNGFAFQATPAIAVPASMQSKLVRGQLTGTRVKVDGQQQFLVTANYYDAQYRLVQTLADNHLGGRDRLTNRYDNLDGRVRFGALVQQSYLEHQTGTGQAHTIAQRFSYDHTGRLKKHEQNLDYQGDVVLARHQYNELGQLVDKELHSTDSERTFLQSVDYRYNIRGWLTHINDRDLSNGTNVDGVPADPDGTYVQPDVFGMELKYESGAHLGGAPQYNGNIAEQLWQSRNDRVLRAYRYDYDRFNRLTAAPYRTWERGANSWNSWGLHGTDFSLSNVRYDQNGNIQHLTRHGATNGNNDQPSQGPLDDLTYYYRGNQLVGVDDAAAPTATEHDFEDNGHKYADAQQAEYNYDAVGNLLRDANKGIGLINYNLLLNLPTRLTFHGAGNRIEYTYSSTGQKLQQRVYQGGALSKTTDYVAGFVYENQQPVFVQTAEGRALYPQDLSNANWTYEYHLKDHLGNLRVAFQPQTGRQAPMRRATMELVNAPTEEEQFDHVASTRRADATHARTGQYEAALNAGAGRSEGPATEFAIVAGDSVHAEVYARYEHAAPRGRAWRSGAIVAGAAVAGSPGQLPRETGAVVPRRRFLPWLGASLAVVPQLLFNRGEEEEAVPEAYLHVDYYAADSQLVASQVQPVMRTSEDAWQPMHLEGRADSTGYVRVYVQSADSKNVYFDDLAARTTSVNLVQVNHYDPWGLNLVGIEQGGSPTSQFQFNGKEKQTDFGLNVYDFEARMYDPAIGKTFQIDPHANNYYSTSPYSWAGNNPIFYVDPTGMDLVIAKYKDLDQETRDKYTKQEYNQMRREGQAAIREGVKQSSSFSAMVKDLKASDNTHTVTFNKEAGGSRQQTNQKTGDSSIEVSVAQKADGLDGLDQRTNTMISAGHELGHSWREEHKLDPRKQPVNEFNGDLKAFFKADTDRMRVIESGATHVENLIRSESKLPLREYYNKNASGGSWYDLNKSNFNYGVRHNIHSVHGVKRIAK